MNKRNFRTLTIGLTLLTGTIGALCQKLSKDEREIFWLQDQRSLGDSALYRYLAHKDAKLRVRAAIALANIQDTSSISYLLPLIDDKSADVRAAVAFALGQIGSPSPEAEIAERTRQESNPEVLGRLLEALGKCGSEKSYDDVVALGLPKKLRTVRADQALSIARFAIRNIKSERGVWFCFDALEEQDTQIRWLALYALWRIAPYGAIDVEISKRKDELKKLCVDKNPDVRMHLATLLGKTRSSEALELLGEIQKHENKKGDWRVQVNLVKSYGALASRKDEAIDQLVTLLQSGNEHVQMAGMSSLGGLSRDVMRKHEGTEILRKRLEELALPSSKRSEIIRGEAIVTIARHFPGDFKYAGLLDDSKASNRLKSKVIEGLSLIPTSENLEILLAHLENDSVRVAMAGWEFVRRLLAPQTLKPLKKDTAVTNELGAKLYRKAKVALLRDDIAITTLVAMAVGDSAVFSLFREDGVDERIIEDLMLAYGNLLSPNDVEAMQAILETLGRTGDDRVVPLLERALMDPDKTVAVVAATSLKRLTGNDYSERIPRSTKPLYTDYDWKALEAIGAKQKVSIQTNKGKFTIQLLKESAPFTVLSTIRLIRRKFYNGLTFHRVVPNFVVQGGDPRGDGWGGPNYAVRTEVSFAHFERGSLGIASAGKDTEGCQFFVTHSSQPHLDGRYTVFATLVSGVDVVDKIQLGDKIVSMSLMP